MHVSPDAARYAVVFAADSGTEALYDCHNRNTDQVVDLCLLVGTEAHKRNLVAQGQGRDFYPVAFAEQAASALRADHRAQPEVLLAAGQAECDSLASR